MSALTAPPVIIDVEPVEPEPTLRGTMLATVAAIGIGFGGFMLWACTASLDSAAIATGTIMVDSRRKTVSHLEGGILDELHVKEGDRVAEGQPLLVLDRTQGRAQLAQLDSQYWAALARTARLKAEQEGQRAFPAPPELAEAAARDPVAAEALAAEQRLMAARWETYDGQLGVQKRKIAQMREQVEALRAQRRAFLDRLAYTEEELKNAKGLLEKGFERKPRVLELQRLTAELRGEVGELQAREAEANQGIAGAEQEMLNLEAARRTEVADEQQRMQTVVADYAERRRSASDVLTRLTVTAPQAGRVVGLRFVTRGSAVPSGAPLMDIVPDNDELVVEAAVNPTDIDQVHPGQEAHVHLTAFKQRRVPPVKGEVVSVSADLLTDERTGRTYYEARVRLDPAELGQFQHVKLYPGMPAEVMIAGAERKAIEYFLSPLTDTMRRSFREE